jgi:hypothetical protein
MEQVSSASKLCDWSSQHSQVAEEEGVACWSADNRGFANCNFCASKTLPLQALLPPQCFGAWEPSRQPTGRKVSRLSSWRGPSEQPSLFPPPTLQCQPRRGSAFQKSFRVAEDAKVFLRARAGGGGGSSPAAAAAAASSLLSTRILAGPALSQAGFSWAPSPSISALTTPAQVQTAAPAFEGMPTAHPEQPSWLHSQPMLQAIAAPRLLLQPAGLAYHGALPGLAYVTHGGQPELLWHQPGPAAFPLYWPALPNPFAYSPAGAAAAASLQAPRLTFIPLAEAHEWRAAQQHGNTASSAGKGISLAPTSSSGEQPAASAIEGCPSERRSPATAHTAVGTASTAAACPITVEVRQVSGHPPAQHMTAAPRAPRSGLEGTTAAAAALAARLLGMEEFAPGPDGGAAAQRAAAGRRLLTAAQQMPGAGGCPRLLACPLWSPCQPCCLLSTYSLPLLRPMLCYCLLCPPPPPPPPPPLPPLWLPPLFLPSYSYHHAHTLIFH